VSAKMAGHVELGLEILDTDYRVTDEQRASLNERGWTSIPDLLTTEVTNLIRSQLSGLKPKDYRGQFANLAPLFAKQSASHSGAWQRPFLHRVATSRRLSGVALQLTGQSSAVLADDVGFLKEPGCPAAPFHQDHPQFPFDRKGCVTLWIALVDITEKMGPLRYLNGSHLDGLLGFAGGEDMMDAFPELRSRSVGAGTDIKAGSALAHWDTTVHGTAANQAAVAREAWAVRFIRPDTVYNGVSHVHFDKFEMKRGDKFSENTAFSVVGHGGLLPKP